MRAPPPARALSTSAGTWLGLQKLLFAASAAVAVYWAGAHLGVPGPGLPLASLIFGGVVAAVAGRVLAEPPTLLAWDGAAWSVDVAGAGLRPGRPLLMLDLGGWMLVRFDPEGSASGRQARWLPLSRRDAGAAWPALRVALHQDRAAVGPASPLRADRAA